jgi:hypothetical protein
MTEEEQSAARLIEMEIEKAEQQEAAATLQSDIKALEALWSESFLVSGTSNLVLTKSQALTLFRAGRIQLKTFERRVSRVMVTGKVAIASGNETFIPREERYNFATVVCSYMNVWHHETDGWKLLGRHVGMMTTRAADAQP